TSGQFYQTDYTKPLLFMADGGLLDERAEAQHLLGDQWGLMNETGSYPGQPWLWLYALWYQVEPMKSSPNADIQVLLIMALLSVTFICIPIIDRISVALTRGARGAQARSAGPIDDLPAGRRSADAPRPARLESPARARRARHARAGRETEAAAPPAGLSLVRARAVRPQLA